jgi:hypothetical protein
MSSAVYGFGAISLVAAGVVGWVGSRRILLSPYPGTPLITVFEGWQGLTQLIRAWPQFALIAVVIKLSQLLGFSVRTLMLAGRPVIWLMATLPIELGFALAWAFVALRIDLYFLAPEVGRAEVQRRTRRAVLYALIFWGCNIATNLAGFVIAVLLPLNNRLIVLTVLNYSPYLFIVAAALTRPAIAIDVPRPFLECLRILRENWFGILVTLGIGALPLGSIFLTAWVIRHTGHLGVVKALLLEIPLGVLATVTYAGFESTIAAMYRRIM